MKNRLKEDWKDFSYYNRWFKMHPHELFSQYEYSLYIDGSVLVVADVLPLVLKMIKEDNFLGIHTHSNRKYLQTEAKAIIKLKPYIDQERLKEQLKEYKENGYNDNLPLLEATIILRKHNDNKCIKVMEDWWKEFLRWIPRDQISFPYVLWKNDITIDDITILGRNEFLNPRFIINGHK